MRTSSNPAFRNLPIGGAAGGPYAGFNQSQAGVPGYGAPRTAQGADERPMTVDDVVMKTGACIGTALLTGTVTAVWAHSQLAAGTTGGIFLALIGGMLVGLGLALFISFKQKTSPALILGYSAAEGVFLGAVTAVFESMLPASASGLALQAILGTGIVFVTMLVVYKTGAVKVTPKLRKWVIGAAAAAFGLILINLLLSFVGVDLGLRGNGPLGIIIGIVFIGIAAFMLLLDFDMADTMIRQGMPQRFAWLAAFGLMTTLVWLYFEMVRLLWALQSE